MGKSKTLASYALMNRFKACRALPKGNRFQVLRSSQSLEPTNFLDLPRELRDDIYLYLVSEHGRYWRRGQGWLDSGNLSTLTVKNFLEDHADLNPFKHEVRGAFAMLYLNKQVFAEFQETLQRYTPHHYRIFMGSSRNHEHDLLEEPSSMTSIPANSVRHLMLDIVRRLDLRLAFEPPGPRLRSMGSDRVWLLSRCQAFFQEFDMYMQQCHNVVNLAVSIDRELERRPGEWYCGPPVYWQGYIANGLAQVIESLPHVLRYYVNIMFDAVYARRPTRHVAWADPVVARKSRGDDGARGGPPPVEWLDLFRDLNQAYSDENGDRGSSPQWPILRWVGPLVSKRC